MNQVYGICRGNVSAIYLDLRSRGSLFLFFERAKVNREIDLYIFSAGTVIHPSGLCVFLNHMEAVFVML